MNRDDLKVRLFVAIELPENLKKSLSEVVSSLAKSRVDVKWVKVENLHMTLKFLGDTDHDKLPEIIAALDTISRRQIPFTVNVSGYQFLPPRENPRILAVETDQQERLKRLAVIVQDYLEKYDFSKEKRFKSHITLGRLKGTTKNSKLKQLTECEKPAGSFPVQSVSLYKSILTPTGPIYKVLHRAEFKAQVV
ncbi:RNA 2',3'-cyclic phosphodiesterase [uncultured Desulfuromusa sp.]|uniref:RNA 2',3'-cyclic phosphodiesterase n=1 Tax=uncultured Desulfuromusa sp. TaxID=219183 RepID=UPI002AA62734|nr:RNA 2',3'-cyclic phosphodiesterase [uncultured Desulfuromusa sp.]